MLGCVPPVIAGCHTVGLWVCGWSLGGQEGCGTAGGSVALLAALCCCPRCPGGLDTQLVWLLKKQHKREEIQLVLDCSTPGHLDILGICYSLGASYPTRLWVQAKKDEARNCCS